ncbi:DEAD/DEAH box helicase [Ferroacidibacillus organovorans]|uniref:Helicase ATP-binding domain-containing protein n=1 Tax=Ferroacidibacillus organovorans TaxID=1765683 RepID=A0A853K7J6_9BACL|nr:DEAD/DEAH box helicase [Ferroacidibacillus organovorans]KYP79596.1 hypothetical protein AYJ22_14125 [Ferroacidibacillus organovorans]OAG91647.1 hypothetical protein AYW79_13675 [Ferroacidibacillus organovorans]
MFDSYAQQLLRQLPDLPGLDSNECRRYLSKAYFYILRQKIQLGEVSAEEDLNSFSEVVNYLRNLANTLETIAIFDSLNGVDVPWGVKRSCAFVAAEALSLLKFMISGRAIGEETDSFRLESNYVSLESALLYMFGGYDVNAVSVIADLEYIGAGSSPVEESANQLITYLLRLCRGDVYHSSFPEVDDVNLIDPDARMTYGQLIDDIRYHLYSELTRGISLFLNWLAGIENVSLDTAFSILERVHRSVGSQETSRNTEFADIYHFSSILNATVRLLSERAVVHAVPEPVSDDGEFLDDFRSYLRARARGTDDQRGRPYLWPTALEYIEKCLPGPQVDAVIAMPTGSGKSFVAELAITHALSKGWVLYLAPTNALAHQIRRDLKAALHAMKDVEVRAFVGGGEYSQLQDADELIIGSDVVVMTPEKCALVLRLQPEGFENCALCVFDECHLLNDEGRGLAADIVLAELMNVAPNIKFLLMSAMISNPEELAEWLRSVHDPGAVETPIKWRPSRTLRGLVILNTETLNDLFNEARQQANQLKGNRKNVNFEIPLALLVGLSGAWTHDGPEDYLLRGFPAKFPVKATKGKSRPEFESWKNTVSRLVAERFAQAQIPVINFILSSRHHAFSSAVRSAENLPLINRVEEFEPVVQAWLNIADAELGVPTVLWDLFGKGIAVHSSAMLQVEQATSERMFVNQRSKLMFATGTLAQGLNLPAVAVVISGTSLGDSRDEVDNVYGLSRINSLILNGFGRAGRPGFSNQGIGLLVSDHPFGAPVGQEVNGGRALDDYPVMGEQDASVQVHSPLERFISTVASGSFNPQTASNSELALTSLLVEGGEIDTGKTLSKTLGAFQVYRGHQELWLDSARERIKELRDNFFMKPEYPEWLNSVAAVSSMDFFRASRMLSAYLRRGIPNPIESAQFSLLDWLDIFVEVLAHMPPNRFNHILPDESYKGQTVLRKMRDEIGEGRYIDEPDWNLPQGWMSLWHELRDLLKLYMVGATYADIAKKYLSNSKDSVSNGRSSGANPIPAVFKLVRTVFEPLALDAGCFVALNEHLVFSSEQSGRVTDELQALPLCIRCGCDSLGTLSWFRFGFRQRTCAHALQSKAPVPADMASEELRSMWVRQSRREWLSGGWGEEMLLRNARIIVTSGVE